MQNFLDIVKIENINIYMIILNILLIIIIILNSIKMAKTRKEYKAYLKKLGNGKNIEEMIKKYINRVEEINEENQKTMNYCKQMDNRISGCIQKIGMVRYSAFKDTGSDLSFTLAMLDENDDGIVLNGIYSREMSNIYAKPIERGTSKYTLSEEEKEAIKKAISSDENIR